MEETDRLREKQYSALNEATETASQHEQQVRQANGMLEARVRGEVDLERIEHMQQRHADKVQVLMRDRQNQGVQELSRRHGAHASDIFVGVDAEDVRTSAAVVNAPFGAKHSRRYINALRQQYDLEPQALARRQARRANQTDVLLVDPLRHQHANPERATTTRKERNAYVGFASEVWRKPSRT